MIYPVTLGTKITQYFGKTEFDDFHSGLDFSGLGDRKVFASINGPISYEWQENDGGNVLKIGGYALQTRYAHLEKMFVTSGFVEAGTLIGIMGKTGRPGIKVHLHFGVKKFGKYVDPLPLLKSGVQLPIMPDKDDVEDFFRLLKGLPGQTGVPTAAQIANYTKQTWQVLGGDVAKTAVNAYRQTKKLLDADAKPLVRGIKYIAP